MPNTVAQCRKYPIPYLFTLSRTIPYLYTLNRTIPYLYKLNRTIPYPNTLSRTIPYLNTLSRTIPYLNTLSRTIPYLNIWPEVPSRLSAAIAYLNTWRVLHPPPDQLRHLLLRWYTGESVQKPTKLASLPETLYRYDKENFFCTAKNCVQKLLAQSVYAFSVLKQCSFCVRRKNPQKNDKTQTLGEKTML